jgi:hypothetical protein
MDFIRGQMTPGDVRLLDCLLDAFDREKLTHEYYTEALNCRNAFIHDFLLYDLQLRNTKAAYLNRQLGREEALDQMPAPEMEFEGRADVLAVLEQDDILARERGLDSLLWNKIDELTQMHVLDLDVILGLVAKVMITDRWNKLDPGTGRELFRRLVQEIRNTR